jgi:hypothetical protein
VNVQDLAAELYGLLIPEALDKIYAQAIRDARPEIAALIARLDQELAERTANILSALPPEAQHQSEAAETVASDNQCQAMQLLEAQQLTTVYFELGNPPQFRVQGRKLPPGARELLLAHLTAVIEPIINGFRDGTITLEGALGMQQRGPIPRYMFLKANSLDRVGAQLVVFDEQRRRQLVYEGVGFARPPIRSTSAAEKRATQWLIKDLKEHGVEGKSKGERREHCKKHFSVSVNGFNTRVWPEALADTGLTEKATKAGRKKRTESDLRGKKN